MERNVAEVRALEAAGSAARGATAYVTLEPCAHQGRTPPCTAALLRAGVARVRLSGKAGMKRLREQREHGIALYPTIMPALAPWAEKLGVVVPSPVAD